jgi:hypothetical protein
LDFDSSTSPAAVQPSGFDNAMVEDGVFEWWYGPKLVFVQCLPRSCDHNSPLVRLFFLLLFQLRSAQHVEMRFSGSDNDKALQTPCGAIGFKVA